MQVFDVLLNGDHLIVDGLDIFERAGGRAAAYDVHVPFRITGNKLVLTHTGEESEYSGSLRLDFVKVRSLTHLSKLLFSSLHTMKFTHSGDCKMALDMGSSHYCPNAHKSPSLFPRIGL